MGKIRVGNKDNAYLNGEYDKHARRVGKQCTAKSRRARDKRIILTFANKFLSAQQDIDPEIGAVVQKDLWEIL